MNRIIIETKIESSVEEVPKLRGGWSFASQFNNVQVTTNLFTWISEPTDLCHMNIFKAWKLLSSAALKALE